MGATSRARASVSSTARFVLLAVQGCSRERVQAILEHIRIERAEIDDREFIYA